MDEDEEPGGETLTAEVRVGLAEASSFLIDQWLDDLENLTVDLAGRYDFAALAMADSLPARYLPRYTPHLARRFLTCLITVAWKLAHPDPPPLACVAEELACRAILLEAERRVAALALDVDIDALYDVLFEDTDFENLFIPARDGIDEGEVGQILGMGPLALEAWFRPFGRGSRGPVHPYCTDADERPY